MKYVKYINNVFKFQNFIKDYTKNNMEQYLKIKCL
jgi:hypothetical protein